MLIFLDASKHETNLKMPTFSYAAYAVQPFHARLTRENSFLCKLVGFGYFFGGFTWAIGQMASVKKKKGKLDLVAEDQEPLRGSACPMYAISDF